MKNYLFIASLLLMTACQEAAEPAVSPEQKVSTAGTDSEYNETLAKELGADDYGMRPYVMAFLKAGPNRSQDSLEAAELQKAHLENIGRMAEAGQLSVAGPFMDDGELRGIYIFNVTSIEEAKALTETDPAIQAGRLEMDLRPWYGPAALMKVIDLNEQLVKKGITE